ncbi:dihydropteroate synthase [Hyphomonas sp.]|uniref:dihydropteroate synthase n=1 Tax=Hyphomonas sp. TaxID=87 RepID=UPI00391DC969
MIDAARRDRVLEAARNRVLIMGILNVTPDSFSDGGRYDAPGAALAQARRMVEAGADILDVGGESTRPGAEPVSAEEELARVIPVIRLLTSELDVPLSIDTMKAQVARAAVAAGAVIINDVTGLLADPDMPDAAAETEAGVVITYNRGRTDPLLDAVRDMEAFFEAAVARAQEGGILRERIWLDPGIGFAKAQEQNLELISHLESLARFGLPVLAGLSRKSFLAHVTGRPVQERLAGTIAANLIAVYRGARILRVHDVAEHADALKVFEATGTKRA